MSCLNGNCVYIVNEKNCLIFCAIGSSKSDAWYADRTAGNFILKKWFRCEFSDRNCKNSSFHWRHLWTTLMLHSRFLFFTSHFISLFLSYNFSCKLFFVTVECHGSSSFVIYVMPFLYLSQQLLIIFIFESNMFCNELST